MAASAFRADGEGGEVQRSRNIVEHGIAAGTRPAIAAWPAWQIGAKGEESLATRTAITDRVDNKVGRRNRCSAIQIECRIATEAVAAIASVRAKSVTTLTGRERTVAGRRDCQRVGNNERARNCIEGCGSAESVTAIARAEARVNIAIRPVTGKSVCRYRVTRDGR